MVDETRIQVLKEPERNPETDSFMWLFWSSEDGLPLIYWNIVRVNLCQMSNMSDEQLLNKYKNYANILKYIIKYI